MTAAVVLALGAGGGDDPDGDRLDPDRETVIDREIDDDRRKLSEEPGQT